MARRPSGRRWNLTVRDGTLVLDAPHGVLAVRALDPGVARAVAELPDDTDVECDGDYDGPGNISFLIVTRIVTIRSILEPSARGVDDVIVRESPDLARARAAERLGAGDLAGAVADLELALRGGADGAEAVYAHLPDDDRAALLDAYAVWAVSRARSTWEALRWLPLARWMTAHVERAIAKALELGGRFGTLVVEQLVDELARRAIDTKALRAKVTRLRNAQAREGGTSFRIDCPLEDAVVVGATRDRVYVAGRLVGGPAGITPPGAKRVLAGRRIPTVIEYDTEGQERARYVDVEADRVASGHAIQLHHRGRSVPHVRRLADDHVTCTFTGSIVHCDGELVCGPTDGLYEVREVATNRLVASWPADGVIRHVWWDAELVHVVGDMPAVYARATGQRVGTKPRTPHTDWTRYWQGWICQPEYKRVRVGSDDGERIALSLAPKLAVDLAPPWLAFRHPTRPIALVALGEVMTSAELRIDGHLLAKRAPG